jgi:hypothetical protein
VICDGHRRDFVRPELCPSIVDLARTGRRFENRRGVFPSVTRASSASIARAEALKGDRPLSYHVASEVAALGRRFDLAFSHEVLYLLPDLAAHARDMAAVLKPGASISRRWAVIATCRCGHAGAS